MSDRIEYGVDVPMPYHLDLSNPALSVCSGCGRSTWSESEFGRTCGMPQPSGARCSGVFPPGSPAALASPAPTRIPRQEQR